MDPTEASHILIILYFYKNKKVNVDDFRLHDKVDILAEVVSKVKTREDGTTFRRQGLYGVAIKKAGEIYEPRKMFFCKADKKYYAIGLNKIYMEGILTGIYRVGDGMYRYIINNLRKGPVNQINLLQRTETEPDISIGTRIAIDAVITTKKRESEGYTNHFQDYIICSVRVLD